LAVTKLQNSSNILQKRYTEIIAEIGKMELTDSILKALWSIYPTVNTHEFVRWPERVRQLLMASMQDGVLLNTGEKPLEIGLSGMSFAKDITEAQAREIAGSLKGSSQAFEVFPGVRIAGAYDPRGIWDKLGLTNSCANKRVLEIGPAEGFYTKQLADAGADVTALDYRSKEATGFHVMERLSGRRFEYIQGNILNADAAILGTFDIVLFMGVLYHLPDLIRALDNCRSLCRETLFLESLCDASLPTDIPAARYLPSNSAGGDWTNFWAPNRLCLHGMLRDCGFQVMRDETWGDRILVEARTIHRPGARLKPDMAYSRNTI
jgi:tRNA (mo5U34)-methyltransferase